VTYREAAEMGIDNLEHGFFVSTDFAKDKQPDQCPKGGLPPMLLLDPDSAEVRDLLRTLVAHHVAVTSTLPVFEQGIPGCHRRARRVPGSPGSPVPRDPAADLDAVLRATCRGPRARVVKALADGGAPECQVLSGEGSEPFRIQGCALR
jgi:hypothetical protein